MSKIPGLREGPHIPLPCSYCSKWERCWGPCRKPLGKVKNAFEGCKYFVRSGDVDTGEKESFDAS